MYINVSMRTDVKWSYTRKKLQVKYRNLTPCGPSSKANDRVNWSTAAFDVQ